MTNRNDTSTSAAIVAICIIGTIILGCGFILYKAITNEDTKQINVR